MTCISYNHPEEYQTQHPAALRNPFSTTSKTVCIDACIIEAIKALWAAGIETMNSCCTHGDGQPEIILRDHATIEDIADARAIVAKVDTRKFVFLSWTVGEYGPELTLMRYPQRKGRKEWAT